MPKRKKSLKNGRKTRRSAKRFKFVERLILGLKLSAAAATVLAVTTGFILAHDLLTQSEYFEARQVTIEGMQRLTREQVGHRAGSHDQTTRMHRKGPCSTRSCASRGSSAR